MSWSGSCWGEAGFELVAASDRDEVAGICRRFADFYRQYGDKFPSQTQSNESFDRLCRAYPIHPEVFDRLYKDWSTLEEFQRTSGVLQYMAIVIHRLWNSENRDALIMPGTLPLDDTNVRTKSIHYLPLPGCHCQGHRDRGLFWIRRRQGRRPLSWLCLWPGQDDHDGRVLTPYQAGSGASRRGRLESEKRQQEQGASGTSPAAASEPSGDTTSSTPLGGTSTGIPSTASTKKLFYGTVTLDPIKAKMDFATIMDEVVEQFTSKLGVDVNISVEIQAQSKDGFDDALQRSIKENCNMLKFNNSEFE